MFGIPLGIRRVPWPNGLHESIAADLQEKIEFKKIDSGECLFRVGAFRTKGVRITEFSPLHGFIRSFPGDSKALVVCFINWHMLILVGLFAYVAFATASFSLLMLILSLVVLLLVLKDVWNLFKVLSTH